MNKLRVIDLLNKIANGEDVPKKIKWGCHIYIWLAVEYKALDELGEPLFSEQAGYTQYSLNDEVEVIEDKKTEEDKKIEKIDYYRHVGVNLSQVVCDKINEIIDKLNNLEK